MSAFTQWLRGEHPTDEEILQSEEITAAPPVMEHYPAPLCWIERIGAWMLTTSNADPICMVIITAAIIAIMIYAFGFGVEVIR